MAVGGCYLLTQQRSSRSGGRQGLLGHPLADLLKLVLNKVLQGGELRLAAATSVHVIFICNEPAVSGAWEGFQPQADTPKGGIRTRGAFPSPPKGAENTLGSPGCQAPSPEVCSSAHPRKSSIQQGITLTIHLGCRDPKPLLQR